ncbi:hypothetical protein ACWEV3_17450 [Saccharopolyspora sp. NPDC003752]
MIAERDGYAGRDRLAGRSRRPIASDTERHELTEKFDRCKELLPFALDEQP